MSTLATPSTEVMPGPLTMPIVAPTPHDMLSRAVAAGASIEIIERLLALHERAEASAARRAFDAAIAAAKAQIKPVVRNATGHNAKRYADFAAIAREVDPPLSEHGLSYRFRTAQNERILVTCILSHVGGHSEETTLAGPPDTSGNKNAIQAIGSTLTYLQRYSLIQALGLAVSDSDDDGDAAGERRDEYITEEQQANLRKLCEEGSVDVEKLCRDGKVATLANVPTYRYQAFLDAIENRAVAPPSRARFTEGREP